MCLNQGIVSYQKFLAFDDFYIPVFYHRKFFDVKALGIVVGANGVYEIAGSNQVASGYVARPDNELFGIGSYRIRIGVEVADNTIYFYALLHVTRNYPAVIRS